MIHHTTPTRRMRTGFTLVEVVLAGTMTVFLLAAMSTTIGQLGRSKSISKARSAAFHRADIALTEVRRQIITMTRSDDLFYSRFLLFDHSQSLPGSGLADADRDELLVFNTNLRRTVDSQFAGEGLEFEAHMRIEEGPTGPTLWTRRDPVPDQYELAGGLAIPTVEGVFSLSIEAFDGLDWYTSWDSDFDGIPKAVRIVVAATGAAPGEDPYENAPIAIMRTVVPIDRVLPPLDLYQLVDEELDAILQAEAAEDAETDGVDDGAGAGDAGAGFNLPEGVNFEDLPPEVQEELRNRGNTGGRGPRPGSGGTGERPTGGGNSARPTVQPGSQGQGN
jgi:hypothetical protein